MKFLDEYVIILNILLFLLLLFNFIQKFKIIEGHTPTSLQINNAEKGKSISEKGDNMIKQVAEKVREAKQSTDRANKNINNDTMWDKQYEDAKKRDKEIEALNK